jgi:hypothetical protein
MNQDQAQKLFEQLEGREVVVLLKSGPGMTGKVKATTIEGLYALEGMGLDPTKPPQMGVARMLNTKFSYDEVGAVIELGELSVSSPAAISRPQQGEGKILVPGAFR